MTTYKITNVQFKNSIHLGKQMMATSHLRGDDPLRPMERQFLDHGPFEMCFSEDARYVKIKIQSTGFVHLIPMENVASLTVIEE